MMRTRLCLVTPAAPGDDFAETLSGALDGGDVASLLIDPDSLEAGAIEALARIATERGVAALIRGGTVIPGADGVHIEDGPKAVRAARAVIGENGIVGAGGIGSRHDAMTLGELLPDYLFFGRIEEDGAAAIHPKAMDLAVWWAELFQIPAMIMAGNDIKAAAEAAANNIEFVAMRSAVWDHPRGAAEAVRQVNALLDEGTAG